MRSTTFGLTLRFMRARPLRTALATLSVVLGVGLMAALFTLNASSEASVEAHLVKQYGTYDLMAGYRKPNLRLSEEEMAMIRRQPGITNLAGLLIPYMYENPQDLIPLRLNYYGVPNTPLGRQYMPLSTGAFPGPAEVAVTEAWAKQKGLGVGDSIELPFPPGPVRKVRISGLLPTMNQLSSGIGLFERSWLEEATGRSGATFTLLQIARGTDVPILSASLRLKIKDLEVDQRKFLDEARKNLNALRPVGLGMGIAALVASIFLLTGAFRLSLAERSRELAMLRLIGALPGQVRRMVLAEALLTGSLGSVLGVLLGAALAAALAGLTARLLGTEPVPQVLPWAQLALVAAGGTLLALLSALGGAWTAGRTAPLRAMRPDLTAEEQEARRGGKFGLFLLVLGLAALALRPFVPEGDGGPPALVGSTGGLLVALGLLLGLQRLLPLLLTALAFPLRSLVETPVAVRSLLRQRRRSANAVGAMGLGLVLVVAILTLTSSLLGRWFQEVRDLHPVDFQAEVASLYPRGVSADLAAEISRIPGVTQVAAVGEHVQVIITGWDWSRANPEWMAGMKPFGNRYWKGYQSLWVQWADLPALVSMGAYKLRDGSLAGWGDDVIAFARAQAEMLGVKVGDPLEVNIAQTPFEERVARPVTRTYRVTAILEDGSWKLPRSVIAAPLPGSPTSLRGVYASAEPERREAARRAAKALLGQMAYNIAVYSDFESATATLQAQTNQRLALLLAVAGVMALVAVMSLINTMVSSVSERRREFALLRSVGATPVQVMRHVVMEAALLGLAGGIVGVAGGAVLGAGALTGLELPVADLRFPWAAMAAGLLLSVSTACLAALGPARRVANLAPAEAVRAE